MRLTYAPEADAASLKVSNGQVDRTNEIAPDVFVDLTAEGDLVGLEILNASRRPGAKPMKLAFDVLAGQGRQAAE